MKPRLLAFFLILSTCVAYPSGVSAASETNGSRYFINSGSSFWRSLMGTRHTFAGGFSADLSDVQLGVARLAGLKPVPVLAFNILADGSAPTPSPTPQLTPSQPVSWGVREMLADPELKRTEGGTGVRIALVDTGVDASHPDLARRVDGCFDLTDVVKGFIEGQCGDLNGHGTHMAGILVADGGPDGAGSYGFAPNASMSSYRACTNGGSCFSDDVAAAIIHATDAGANIIVLGMGGEAESTLMSDAIAYAAERDVLVVAGAGNDGPYDDSLDWPARSELVVSVAAVDTSNEPAEFSSRGTNASSETSVQDPGDIEFAAPGVNIESTYRDGGYAILSGTSMAAPHIGGLAALLWDAEAAFPAQAVREALHELVSDIAEPGDDNATGSGIPVLVR